MYFALFSADQVLQHSYGRPQLGVEVNVEECGLGVVKFYQNFVDIRNRRFFSQLSQIKPNFAN